MSYSRSDRLLVQKAGALYFALVFGAGFVLGPIRILWFAPRVGTRAAELLEAPVVLAVSVLVARWLIRWLAVRPMTAVRMRMGLVAPSLMLLAEFTLVLWLRGVSIRQYFAERDPVAGTVYYITLVLFAVLPLLVKRK